MAVQRRLATILAADVAGYSRLKAEDEAGIHFGYLAFRELSIILANARADVSCLWPPAQMDNLVRQDLVGLRDAPIAREQPVLAAAVVVLGEHAPADARHVAVMHAIEK